MIQALFGVLLVLLSPVTMWLAQSQHSAKDFAAATPVEITSGASGYITFTGSPSYANTEDGSACIESGCIYQKESKQEFVTREEVVCGSSVESTEEQRIIQQHGTQCDESGANCVPCYDVEKQSWEEVDVVYTTYEVRVGNFTVKPTQSTIYLQTEQKTVETGFSEAGNETRSNYEFFSMPNTLTVAGQSDGSMVRSGDRVFVLSQFDHEGTYEALRARDKSAQKMLWVITFLMLFIGFALILSPIARIGKQFRLIPVIGPLLASGSRMLITLAALILAIPLWLIMFILVVLIKAWWLALILLAVIIILFLWRAFTANKNQEKPMV